MSRVTSHENEKDPKLERAIKAAIAIRDRRAEIKRKHDAAFAEEDAPYKEKYEEIQMWIADQLNRAGSNSLATDAGTAFFKRNTKAKLVDWGALAAHIRETGEIDLLEHRVSKSSVEQYIKDSDGEVPPGVSWEVDRVLNLRKPPKQRG